MRAPGQKDFKPGRGPDKGAICSALRRIAPFQEMQIVRRLDVHNHPGSLQCTASLHGAAPSDVRWSPVTTYTISVKLPANTNFSGNSRNPAPCTVGRARKVRVLLLDLCERSMRCRLRQPRRAPALSVTAPSRE